MTEKIKSILEEFKHKNILIIGDCMLDVYLFGSSSRLSPEAPVPIVDVEKTVYSPGGAGNTAVNASALGAKTFMLSAIGEDESGKILKNEFIKKNVDTSYIVCNSLRKTLTKQRVLSGTHQMVRFDTGSKDAISEETETQLISTLIDTYNFYDAVIVSDYGYGIVTDNVITTLSKLQKKYKKVLFVDSKYLDKFKETAPTVVKPNYEGALRLLGITQSKSIGERIDQISEYRERLFEVTGAETVSVTFDIEGAMVFSKNKSSYRTYTKPVENSKASGAGDTYVSAFSLSLATGCSVETAAEIAAAASAIAVQKDGTTTCTPEELSLSFTKPNKFIKDKKSLSDLVKFYKTHGKKIVFTNGYFDLLHNGHVQLLNQAKALGDVLIVGLNSDERIRQVKGAPRPLNNLSDRVQILSALSSVDHIVSFNEETPIQLIQTIKPDVVVKGGDYTKEKMPEAKLIEQLGGRVEILPIVTANSAKNIVKKLSNISSSSPVV